MLSDMPQNNQTLANAIEQYYKLHESRNHVKFYFLHYVRV